MPQLSPMIIASMIGGGSAIGGGLLARSGAKSIADQQREAAAIAFDRSRPAYDQAYKYYSGLLSGDPATVGNAVNPFITQANQQFNSAQKNMLQSSYGRGGGLTAGLTNLEGNRASTIAQLVGAARASAPEGLARLASGDQTAGLSALANAQTGQYQNGLLQQQTYGGIGSFITRLLSNPALLNGIFNRGSGGQSMIPMSSLPGVNDGRIIPAVTNPNPFIPSVATPPYPGYAPYPGMSR